MCAWQILPRLAASWQQTELRAEGTGCSALGRVMMGTEKQAKHRPCWSFTALQTPQRVEREAQVNNTALLSSFSSPFHLISGWETPQHFPHALYIFCHGPLDSCLVLPVSS